MGLISDWATGKIMKTPPYILCLLISFTVFAVYCKASIFILSHAG